MGFAHADTYRLAIREKAVDLIGKAQVAIVANEVLPAPALRWREGEEVAIEVDNGLNESTSIHWHGIILPYQMDGVPGISFAGIEPGQSFTYRFRVVQSGTYWYHGHSEMQEQRGLYGALIIDPAQSTVQVDRDYVILLSDWPEDDPHRILGRLKKQNDYYDFQKRTLADLFTDMRHEGLTETLNERLDWGQMRMQPTDIADVTGATYTFLINGHTPSMNWSAVFDRGERVRLRFINASAMTHFDVRIPGLSMRMIEADGQAVQAVDVEEFRIAVAETYDVLVKPDATRAYAIFAEAMDRSGFAAATLTPRLGLKAAWPTMRPRSLLTMADMGSMHGEQHHAMDSGGFDADHSGPEQHSGHGVIESPEHHDHSKLVEAIKPRNHTLGSDSEDHAQHSHDTQAAHPVDRESTMTVHPDPHEHKGRAHAAPMQGVPEAKKRLEYQDLTNANPIPSWPAVDREITLRLTGNMNRYIWSFDDLKYSQAQPIRVKFGERIRFHYVNETMMNHPIHLHGLWQTLDLGKGVENPRKHVINVPPGKTRSVVVLADNPGEWAFHCHLMYHMETGMFRKLIVETAPDST